MLPTLCHLTGAASSRSASQAARQGSTTSVQVPLARLKPSENVTRKLLIGDNVTGGLGPSQGGKGGGHVNG